LKKATNFPLIGEITFCCFLQVNTPHNPLTPVCCPKFTPKYCPKKEGGLPKIIPGKNLGENFPAFFKEIFPRKIKPKISPIQSKGPFNQGRNFEQKLVGGTPKLYPNLPRVNLPN